MNMLKYKSYFAYAIVLYIGGDNMIRIRQEAAKNGNPIYYFELDNGGQNLTWSDWVDVFGELSTRTNGLISLVVDFKQSMNGVIKATVERDRPDFNQKIINDALCWLFRSGLPEIRTRISQAKT